MNKALLIQSENFIKLTDAFYLFKHKIKESSLADLCILHIPYCANTDIYVAFNSLYVSRKKYQIAMKK